MSVISQHQIKVVHSSDNQSYDERNNHERLTPLLWPDFTGSSKTCRKTGHVELQFIESYLFFRDVRA